MTKFFEINFWIDSTLKNLPSGILAQLTSIFPLLFDKIKKQRIIKFIGHLVQSLLVLKLILNIGFKNLSSLLKGKHLLQILSANFMFKS